MKNTPDNWYIITTDEFAHIMVHEAVERHYHINDFKLDCLALASDRILIRESSERSEYDGAPTPGHTRTLEVNATMFPFSDMQDCGVALINRPTVINGWGVQQWYQQPILYGPEKTLERMIDQRSLKLKIK